MHAHVLYFAESNRQENRCKSDAILRKNEIFGYNFLAVQIKNNWKRLTSIKQMNIMNKIELTEKIEF